MTLGRCPLSIFCSLGTPVDVMNENPLSQPTLSLSYTVSEADSGRPLLSEYGTYETVKARFLPWLPGQSPYNLQVVPSSLGSGMVIPSSEMCSGSEAGLYLRLIDSCITQLKAQGPYTRKQVKLLEGDGDVAALVRARWSHLLVDEFQVPLSSEESTFLEARSRIRTRRFHFKVHYLKDSRERFWNICKLCPVLARQRLAHWGHVSPIIV